MLFAITTYIFTSVEAKNPSIKKRRLKETKKEDLVKIEKPTPKPESKNEDLKEKSKEKGIVCKNIFYFTGEDSSNKRPLLENKSGVCNYLKKSCCTNDDFKKIKEWWEGKGNNKESRENQRLQTNEDIAIFTEG